MSKIKAAITDGFGNIGNKVQHVAVVGTAMAINKTKNDGPTVAKFAIAKVIKGGMGVKQKFFEMGQEVMAEVKRQQEEDNKTQ